MAEAFDAIVIGTGQSGPALAVRLAEAGQRTAILERKLFGGTCVNVGCIPTKTLVASARVAHMARRAAEFGVVRQGPVRMDMPRVKARKDEVVRASNSGVERWLKGSAGLTVIEGHGRFVGPRRVAVNGRELEAPRVFVNTGGRAAVPPIPGLEQVGYLTNSSMMEVNFLPPHLVIVGGSYIGLEFAQMYRRFGSRVTVIEMAPRLIPREDDDVSDAVRAILEAEGVDVRCNAKLARVERRGKGVTVHLECPGGPEEVHGSHLLVAVGRRPNTDDLGLEAAGIATDARGYIQVDEELRTSAEGVWALGDCNGRGAFTHTSWNDYEIVAANLLDGGARKLSDRIPAYALYIDPPLGRAGLSEREVRATGRPALLGSMAMSKVGRARERSETQGFMKVLVDAETRHILGAALLGIGADEVVHVLLDVMYAGAPSTVIERAMHIHPTVAEFLPTLLGELEPLP
jgi:pyruvate/2-oxoglutarate dehydrogenase complex dihydrolipoamide dehydrogenase (E3) component